MNRLTSGGAALALTLTATPLWAQDAAKSLDTRINEAIAPISNAIAGAVFYSVPIGDTQFPLIVGWLIAGRNGLHAVFRLHPVPRLRPFDFAGQGRL